MGYRNAKGWLRDEERDALVRYARDVRYVTYGQDRATIINIGVEYGASLACLRAGAQHAEIIGIDIDISKAVDNYYCKLVEADSRLLWREWPKSKEIDVLFVDGDHTYEGVRDDTMWTKFVRASGYVIFHDCYDYDDPSIIHKLVPGVDKAVSEWARGQGDDWRERDPVGTMRIFRRIE